MKWLYLTMGLLMETAGFIALKYSQALTKLSPTVITVVADLTALLFFVLALKRFETSFVYMIAAGVGTALVVIANAIVFKQHLNWIQIVSIIIIIIGTIGLQSQGATH